MSRSSRDIGAHLVDPETSRQGDGAAPRTAPDTIDPREPVGSVDARSPWRMSFRRFRKHKMAMVSLVVLIMVVLLAFVGGAVWHYKYNVYSNDLSFSQASSIRSAPTRRDTTRSPRCCAVRNARWRSRHSYP